MGIKTALLKITYLVNRLIPKKKNQIFFYSSPDYSDNARAIYEELVRQNLHKEYSVVWAVRNVDKYRDILSSVKLVKPKSIGLFWHYCRSAYIFRTHSILGDKYVAGRQKMCIAWHGMPLKKLVKSDGTVSKVDCDMILSTAPFFDRELAASTGLDTSSCRHLGLPRNDELFLAGEELASRYPGFDRRFIWMPTFRNANGFVDGVDSEIGLPFLSRSQLSELNEALKQLNYLLILKLHPWSAEKLDGICYSNIVNLKDSDIVGQASLYKLLGQTDALITDYSSVYIDYLLTDKPICFAYDDLEQYRETRGFAFEPVENYMPGQVVSNCDELIGWFRDFEKADDFAQQRRELKYLFYAHPDGESSKRVLQEMGITGRK